MPEEHPQPVAAVRALAETVELIEGFEATDLADLDVEEVAALWDLLSAISQSVRDVRQLVEDELIATMDEDRLVANGHAYERRFSKSYRKWRNDELRSDTLKWCRFDPDTGEEFDTETALARVADLYNLSGSSARTTALRKGPGIDPDEYAEHDLRASVRRLA